MDLSTSWPRALPYLGLAVPFAFGLAALLPSRQAPFRLAGVASSAALALALGVSVGTALAPEALSGFAFVRLDLVTGVMLMLVCGLAVVVVRYSKPYLMGDSGQRRYVRSLMTALAAVTALVLSNHLGALSVAWLITSLALHRLLTHFGDRPQALIAAHKKFLLSRLADVCLLLALVLIGRTVGSLDLDAVNAWAQAHATLPLSLQGAAVLLVLTVVLRSAQLPFHGWLTQVMEAPTPVSALLHAGVVNIGGLVMIRLAPLMARASPAQTLLVLVGLSSAVLGALIMTTRVSVKVALAWSTCAQMGFMLVQCGLGAWHLALLHLVAHSLYKAHAFLSSGSAVEVWRAQALLPRREPPSRVRLAAALVGALVVVAAAATATVALSGTPAIDPTLAPWGLLMAMSLTSLFGAGLHGGAPSVALLRGVGVCALYFAWHLAFARMLPASPTGSPLPWALVVAGFALLFGVQLALQARPEGRLARALQPRLFAGFHLDEVFTRLTFRLWPPRLRPKAPPGSPLPLGSALEARS